MIKRYQSTAGLIDRGTVAIKPVKMSDMSPVVKTTIDAINANEDPAAFYAASTFATAAQLDNLINNSVPCTASESVGGHRAVVITGSYEVSYADKDDPELIDLVFGITKEAIGSGQTGMVQIKGILSEPSWNWTPLAPIFLGNNGMLTQITPNSGYLVPMGVASGVHEMYIAIQPSIELA